MSSVPLRIAIIGAGPAGLTLGVLLYKHDIPFTIFERSPKYTDEQLAKPAGSLDMHEESGLAALSACGLYEEFMALIGDCTEAQKLADKDGNIIYADDGDQSNRPEISRHKLVKLLLSHLPDSTIKWAHKVFSVKRSSTSNRSEIELDFGVSGKQNFDQVIGADGAWSKFRTLLTDVKPNYSGIQNISINLRRITTQYPHLAEMIGTGTFTSLGNKHGVFSQRSVQDSARIYILISTDDEQFPTTSGLRDKTPAQAKDQILGNEMPFSDWGANIRELVAVACDDESADDPATKLDIKPLYMLPVGHTWKHQAGATLIGDAAHLMCPWAGEGVNLAMRDALLISQAIVEACKSGDQDATAVLKALSPLIRDAEVDMLAKAKVEAEETVENGQMMFGGDHGAVTMAGWFKSFQPSAE